MAGSGGPTNHKAPTRAEQNDFFGISEVRCSLSLQTYHSNPHGLGEPGHARRALLSEHLAVEHYGLQGYRCICVKGRRTTCVCFVAVQLKFWVALHTSLHSFKASSYSVLLVATHIICTFFVLFLGRDLYISHCNLTRRRGNKSPAHLVYRRTFLILKPSPSGWDEVKRKRSANLLKYFLKGCGRSTQDNHVCTTQQHTGPTQTHTHNTWSGSGAQAAGP